MKFEIKPISNPNTVKYPNEAVTIARSFTRRLRNEFGTFLQASILFGSAARDVMGPKGDIDVLIIVDDLSIRMTAEVIEAYKIIVEKTIAKVSTKLHITSMTMTSFWEYARVGDPVVINILRDGVSLYDTGFFAPMQALLMQGRIRPTKESVWTYFGRAPRTLINSRWHILQGTLDLYWAVIDSAHSALMHIGEIPPTPEHVSDLLKEKLVKKRLLEEKYADIMENFYKLMKKITHREIREITGSEYEKLLNDAEDFVKRIRVFIEK